MSWTYTGPSNSPRDEVRFLLGDTTQMDESLSNEELDYLLALDEDTYLAAANAAEIMAAKYLKLSATTKKVGDLAISYNNSPVVADKLYKLAIRLRQGRYSGQSTPTPRWVDDSDNIFWVGMNDNDGVTYKPETWSDLG